MGRERRPAPAGWEKGAAPRSAAGRSGSVPQFLRLRLGWGSGSWHPRPPGLGPAPGGRCWHPGRSCPGQIKEQRQEPGQAWACRPPVRLGTAASSEEGARETGPGPGAGGPCGPAPSLRRQHGRGQAEARGPGGPPGAGRVFSELTVPADERARPPPSSPCRVPLAPGSPAEAGEQLPAPPCPHLTQHLGWAGRCRLPGPLFRPGMLTACQEAAPRGTAAAWAGSARGVGPRSVRWAGGRGRVGHEGLDYGDTEAGGGRWSRRSLAKGGWGRRPQSSNCRVPW